METLSNRWSKQSSSRVTAYLLENICSNKQTTRIELSILFAFPLRLDLIGLNLDGLISGDSRTLSIRPFEWFCLCLADLKIDNEMRILDRACSDYIRLKQALIRIAFNPIQMKQNRREILKKRFANCVVCLDARTVLCGPLDEWTQKNSNKDPAKLDAGDTPIGQSIQRNRLAFGTRW